MPPKHHLLHKEQGRAGDKPANNPKHSSRPGHRHSPWGVRSNPSPAPKRLLRPHCPPFHGGEGVLLASLRFWLVWQMGCPWRHHQLHLVTPGHLWGRGNCPLRFYLPQDIPTSSLVCSKGPLPCRQHSYWEAIYGLWPWIVLWAVPSGPCHVLTGLSTVRPLGSAAGHSHQQKKLGSDCTVSLAGSHWPHESQAQPDSRCGPDQPRAAGPQSHVAKGCGFKEGGNCNSFCKQSPAQGLLHLILKAASWVRE